MRVRVVLVCKECRSRNYYTTKRRDQKAKLELRKYCPRCRKHTLHAEHKL